VNQNIESAAEYYKLAADGGHPEADQNYRRCLRLLGRWTVPDRSSAASEPKPSFEEQPKLTKKSLAIFKKTGGMVENWKQRGELGKGELAIVKLVQDPKGKMKRAVKTLQCQMNIRYLERERSIHEKLNHPLIVGFEKYIPSTAIKPAQIVTELVPNGSLADHLPSTNSSKLNCLSGGTRIAIIIAGIVLAMRYLQSLGIIHRDLKPANIFIHWDWTIRIGDFNHSRSVDDLEEDATLTKNLSIDGRYSAPECFESAPTINSDVFSFGLILYELVTGKPGFPSDTPQQNLMKKIVIEKFRPDIPDFITSNVRSLILECWEEDPMDRPSFGEILSKLDGIGFKIVPEVRSSKVRKFVKAVKRREQELGIEIDDLN
jgi:serine/threonine protein kinase